MKILFLSDNYHPEMTANARIVRELSNEWIKLGGRVLVITSFPNFPRGKIFAGYKNKIYQTEKDGLINILRIKTFMYPNKGVVRRILDFLSYMCTSFIAGLFQKKDDVIIAITPQLFCAVSGCVLSLIRRKPFVLFLCDLWPDSVVSVGAMKMSLAMRLVKKIERWLYKKSSIIFILSPSFRAYLNKLGISDAKIHLSISGYDPTIFYPKDKNISLLNKYSLKDKFVVGYIGTMGMAHDLDIVFQIANIFSEEKIAKFMLIGDGIDRDILAAKAELLDNVIIRGPFPSDVMPEYWSIMDVTLIILRDIDTNETVIPSKMLESMSMGKPILLYAPKGAASKFLEQAESGVFVEIGELDLLIIKLRELISNKQQQKFFSKNAIEFAKKYTRPEQARYAFNKIQEILGQ